MTIQLIHSWKPPMTGKGYIVASRFLTVSAPRSLLLTSALTLLLTACGSNFNDEEVLLGSPATDIDEVANPPVPDAKFSMASDQYQLTGSLPTVEVVQQARSEIYIHE